MRKLWGPGAEKILELVIGEVVVAVEGLAGSAGGYSLLQLTLAGSALLPTELDPSPADLQFSHYYLNCCLEHGASEEKIEGLIKIQGLRALDEKEQEVNNNPAM